MFKLLKDSLNFFDWLILACAVYMFSHFDYSNLSVMNIVYIVAFFAWLIMLLVRVFIINKKRRKK